MPPIGFSIFPPPSRAMPLLLADSLPPRGGGSGRGGRLMNSADLPPSPQPSPVKGEGDAKATALPSRGRVGERGIRSSTLGVGERPDASLPGPGGGGALVQLPVHPSARARIPGLHVG